MTNSKEEVSRWNEFIGPFWGTPHAATVLNVSEEEIVGKIGQKELFGLKTLDDTTVLPSFQFVQDKNGKWSVLPALKDILTPFQEINTRAMDWTLASWLNNGRQPSLGDKTIVENLEAEKDPKPAIDVAVQLAGSWNQ